MSYVVYILKSKKQGCRNKTYTGITNNMERRLRQHNGEIKGGANATRKLRPVSYFITINGFDKRQALSVERTIKHLKRRNIKYYGIVGTLLCIGHLSDINKISMSNVKYHGL